MADKLHSGGGADSKVADGCVGILIVRVENNMTARKLRSPAEDGENDSVEFFELNITMGVTARNPNGEPAMVEDATGAFRPARIRVNMDDVALREEEMDSIPRGGKCGPPFQIAPDGTTDSAAREGGFESGGKVEH